MSLFLIIFYLIVSNY